MEEPRRQQGAHDWQIKITGVLDDSGWYTEKVDF